MSEATVVLSKPQILAELTKAPVHNTATAAGDDPNFFAHLLAWNRLKGEVRDAKVALPVIAYTTGRALGADAEYLENALAHLALLDPRLLSKAVLFLRALGKADMWRTTRRLVARYLREVEARGQERQFLQHRRALSTLYRYFDVKPGTDLVRAVLRSRDADNRMRVPAPPGSATAAVQALALVSPAEAARLIERFHIPSLVAKGATSRRAASAAVDSAIVGEMSANQAVKAARMRSTKDASSTVRRALGRRLRTAAGPASTLAASQAAQVAEELGDSTIAEELQALQERQIDALADRPEIGEGNWLVLADKSPSMMAARTMDLAREVASLLARVVKGQTHLVFFDSDPTYFNVTGKTLKEISVMTRGMAVGPGTSIGAGLQLLLDRGLAVDGIAIVSDGEENVHPAFAHAYLRYAARFGVEPTVYLYHTSGSKEPLLQNCQTAKVGVQTLDITGAPDRYSLPTLVQTMRVGRYSLIDEVQSTPLWTLDRALPRTAGTPVLLAPAAVPTLVVP